MKQELKDKLFNKKFVSSKNLPEYRDGGKKFAAGLAGFATKIPMLGKVIDPMVSNTKLAQEFDTAFNAGQMAGGVANTVANAAVGNVAGAISSGADTVQEGLEMGSSIASNNNNLDRAKKLTTASTAFGALEQGAGMFNTSQFGGGFNPMQMMGDANIPMMMKNGGKLNKLGVENSLWNNIRANAGSGKKPTPEMLEQERKIKAKYEDGGYTDLIKYDGATHDNSPIDGIPIAANGQQLNSGFSNNIPPATKALVEDGEYYIKDKNYVITNNDKLKPTKDMSFLNPKKTFAKNLTTIKNKYKGRENDPITETSYKREENRLIEANETMRLAKEAKTNPNPLMMAKNGGKLPKYFNGGTVPEVTPNYPLVGPLDNSWKTNMFGSNYKVPNIEEEIITGEQDISPITAFGSEKALKRQTGYSYKDGILGKQTDNNPFKMTTGDKLQLGAGALSGITNLAMGMKKPEEYPTLTSPYFGAGLNDMNQNVRFNTNPILMNRNVGMNQINQGSTSDGVRRANLQSLTSNTNRALGELAEKEALANVGIKQSLGQAKIGVGQQDLAARMDSQNKNIASKAIAQNLRAKGLEQIYGSVSDTGKGMNQSRTNTIQLNVLNSLAAQYGLDPKKLEIIFKQQGITTTK